MPRPTRDELFIKMTQLVATRSTCPRKHVGAVIVRDNRIMSIGYNGAPPGMPHCDDVGCEAAFFQRHEGGRTYQLPGCVRAIHAEMNAIAFAARQGARTDDATMYSTCATCANCAALLVSSGIARFVYREPYRLTAGIDLLNNAGVEVMQYGAIR